MVFGASGYRVVADSDDQVRLIPEGGEKLSADKMLMIGIGMIATVLASVDDATAVEVASFLRAEIDGAMTDRRLDFARVARDGLPVTT